MSENVRFFAQFCFTKKVNYSSIKNDGGSSQQNKSKMRKFPLHISKIHSLQLFPTYRKVISIQCLFKTFFSCTFFDKNLYYKSLSKSSCCVAVCQRRFQTYKNSCNALIGSENVNDKCSELEWLPKVVWLLCYKIKIVYFFFAKFNKTLLHFVFRRSRYMSW